MTIKSLKDITRTLQEYDTVEFHFADEIIQMTVCSTYLNYTENNDRIFEKLGLDKKAFCKKAYGYELEDCDWPRYMEDDYEAATRCVKALYKEMVKQSTCECEPSEDSAFLYCLHGNYVQHKSLTPNPMANLKDRFLTIFSKEPQKSFRKAGIVDGDNLLTNEGREVFLSWLLNSKFGEEFKKEVVDELIREQKEEKE